MFSPRISQNVASTHAVRELITIKQHLQDENAFMIVQDDVAGRTGFVIVASKPKTHVVKYAVFAPISKKRAATKWHKRRAVHMLGDWYVTHMPNTTLVI